MTHFTVLLENSPHSSSDLLATFSREQSEQLPARSTVMLTGIVNDRPVRIALEPTGQFTHWFVIDAQSAKALKVKAGDTITIEATVTKEWPEPIVPKALLQVIQDDSDAKKTWHDTTVMARWEWVRWFESVKTDAAKAERPEKIRSMLAHGKRRPCCFNLAARNEPKALELL